MARDRGGSQYAASAAWRSAAAGHRRYVKGDRASRKLLNRMPEAMRDSAVAMMEGVGDEIAAAQRADSPSSRVRAAISRRVSRATLRLRVGLIGRPVNRRLFFARILEGGRRARTVVAVRRGRRYPLRVRAMAARPFIYSQRRKLAAVISRRINAFWDHAFGKAGQSVDDA